LREFRGEAEDRVVDLILNQRFYDPADEMTFKLPRVTLNLTFETVDGHVQCLPMAGPQFLIGQYALYQGDQLCKLIQVDKNKTFKIRTVPPGAPESGRILKGVPESQLIPIEEYGIGVYNQAALP